MGVNATQIDQIVIVISYNHRKSMDVKMHRYMQRIEKIIHTPSKLGPNMSPHRPAKSPLSQKPNRLDRYIKYELSMKMINSIISRTNTHLAMVFFNMIRNSDYRQKQKIYKFVAIQRNEVRVDLGVAAKLMVAVVKQLLKKRFSHFLVRLQNDRPFQSAFKKLLRQDLSPSGELLRTTSLDLRSNVVKPSEWIQDMDVEQEKTVLVKKINVFREYTAKVISKNINQFCMKSLRAAFQTIKLHAVQIVASNLKAKSFQNQIKTWEQRQKNYLFQIQQLSEKLSKCQLLLLKQSSQKMNESVMKNKPVDSSRYLKSQVSQNNIFCFISKKADKQKYRFLQQIITLIHQVALNKKKQRGVAKIESFLKGSWKLTLLLNKIYRYSIQKMKQAKIKKPSNASILVIPVLQLTKKRVIQYYSFFFRQLHKLSTVKPQVKYEFLGDSIECRSNSSRNIENKCNLNKNVLLNSSTITPLAKPNFHLFIDKIFKLILVISKLLIPLRQSFDRINQYALYSYEIEDKFKAIGLKNIRQSFRKLAQYDKKGHKGLVKLMVLQGLVRERLVQSFSHIKIISKENELKIKLVPVKFQIVEMTKQFIEERKIYSQTSLDNWSRIRQNMLQDVKSSQQKEKNKKVFNVI